MTRSTRYLVVGMLVGIATPAGAEPGPNAASGEGDGITELARPRFAGEVNVLWPLIGISELKVIVPVAGHGDTRGELVTGVYADYAQIVRPDAGKVALLAAIVGWRQFVYRGLHVELTATIGVRHETDHPADGMTLNDGYIRAWPMVGYQLELSPRVYVNARGGAGVLVYRQTHWSEERKLAPAADVNVGVWF